MNLEEKYELYHTKLQEMVSNRSCPEYYTGKTIKDTVLKCIEVEKEFLGVANRRYLDFYDKYINSEYPLSDNGLYMLSSKFVGIGDSALMCYKQK